MVIIIIQHLNHILPMTLKWRGDNSGSHHGRVGQSKDLDAVLNIKEIEKLKRVNDGLLSIQENNSPMKRSTERGAKLGSSQISPRLFSIRQNLKGTYKEAELTGLPSTMNQVTNAAVSTRYMSPNDKQITVPDSNSETNYVAANTLRESLADDMGISTFGLGQSATLDLLASQQQSNTNLLVPPSQQQPFNVPQFQYQPNQPIHLHVIEKPPPTQMKRKPFQLKNLQMSPQNQSSNIQVMDPIVYSYQELQAMINFGNQDLNNEIKGDTQAFRESQLNKKNSIDKWDVISPSFEKEKPKFNEEYLNVKLLQNTNEFNLDSITIEDHEQLRQSAMVTKSMPHNTRKIANLSGKKKMDLKLNLLQKYQCIDQQGLVFSSHQSMRARNQTTQQMEHHIQDTIKEITSLRQTSTTKTSKNKIDLGKKSELRSIKNNQNVASMHQAERVIDKRVVEKICKNYQKSKSPRTYKIPENSDIRNLQNIRMSFGNSNSNQNQQTMVRVISPEIFKQTQISKAPPIYSKRLSSQIMDSQSSNPESGEGTIFVLKDQNHNSKTVLSEEQSPSNLDATSPYYQYPSPSDLPKRYAGTASSSKNPRINIQQQPKGTGSNITKKRENEAHDLQYRFPMKPVQVQLSVNRQVETRKNSSQSNQKNRRGVTVGAQ